MQALDTKLQRDFGIAFEDKTLLETAFTHTSYANEHRLLNISHNERLEFFRRRGSSTFDFSVFVQKISEEPEGDLSKMRSVIVREESLAGFSRYCGFDEFIKLGNGEEKSGGRNRDTILGDLFEAFLGALLMDQGVEAVNKFLNQVMIPQVEKVTLNVSKITKQLCKNYCKATVMSLLTIVCQMNLVLHMPKSLK